MCHCSSPEERAWLTVVVQLYFDGILKTYPANWLCNVKVIVLYGYASPGSRVGVVNGESMHNRPMHTAYCCHRWIANVHELPI